jgi:hypothetical protein
MTEGKINGAPARDRLDRSTGDNALILDLEDIVGRARGGVGAIFQLLSDRDADFAELPPQVVGALHFMADGVDRLLDDAADRIAEAIAKRVANGRDDQREGHP